MIINNMKELRNKKGVSQSQCAKETGIPMRTIRRYDQGENIGNIDYAIILADYFSISLEELLLKDENNI